MAQKTILLFGAQGMLGTEVFNQSLERDDVEILPLSRFNADLRTPEAVEEILEKFAAEREISGVVNAAAFTTVDKCEEEKLEEMATQINGMTPGVMAKKCKELNIPFYHFSTDYVFNGETDQKFLENDKTNPCNAYGKTKELGEKNVLQNGGKVIRVAWLAGDNGVNFVHKMVHLSKNVENISIVTNEKGNPTFVKDVAESLFELTLNPEKYPEKIYHFVSEGNASRRELVEEIQKFLELKTNLIDVKPDYFELPAKRPYSSILENTKFPKLPNWKDALHVFLAGEKEKLDKKREIEAKKTRAKELYRKKQAEEREAAANAEISE